MVFFWIHKLFAKYPGKKQAKLENVFKFYLHDEQSYITHLSEEVFEESCIYILKCWNFSCQINTGFIARNDTNNLCIVFHIVYTVTD